MSTNRAAAHPRGAARGAIVEHARALFSARGYDGTTLRDIAQAAEVSEALLYRYFPDKGQLFSEAVIDPFHGFVEQYLSSWEQLDAPRSNDEMVARFVTELYAVMLEHRQLLFALVAATRFNDQDPNEHGLLSQGIKRLAAYTAQEAETRGLAHIDLEMAVACTVGMVFSMTALDDLLFDPQDHPSQERLLAQMSRYAAAGIQQRSD